MVDKLTIGGILTARLTRKQLAEQMVEDCNQARAGKLPIPKIIVSSNGSVIADYHRKSAFRAVLQKADLIDADGMPQVIASRLLCSRPLKERVATTDFITDAAKAAVEHGLNFYFLGGKPEVVKRAVGILSAKYPGLKIVGYRDGYFGNGEEKAICREIRAAKTDILWVGLGSPLQEMFAARNQHRLRGVAWIRTCGGLFDHCVGATRRAPNWLQKIGLEWLWRVAQEPLRLGPRYFFSIPFAVFYLATLTHD